MFGRPDHRELHAESVPLSAIAERVGTPTYVYSKAAIEARYNLLTDALSGCRHQICYAVKANSNLSILALMARLGAGFDIVSGGELERVMRAGGNVERVVFSGVGKTTAEIDFGIKAGIGGFNVESEAELLRIETRAKLLSRVPNVSLRVNPDVDAQTHPYIATGLKDNKFGVPEASAVDLYRYAAASPHLNVVGIDCHIGSQITTIDPFMDALGHLVALVDRLADDGITLSHVDLGGGLGIAYQHDETPLDVAQYGAAIAETMSRRDMTVLLEPGRFLVAEAGLLLTRVEYLKPAGEPSGKNFAVVDAAMNDLIRPALYQAWHGVETVAATPPAGTAAPTRWDVVGPVCESGDFLALGRALTVDAGDLLAIRSAGAYGFVQSSNYNTRGRAAEVLVDGDRFDVVRRRESVADLLRLESIV